MSSARTKAKVAADTSVIVAAFASWHESHDTAREALDRGGLELIAHCALETYAVLTRLPAPHRAAPGIVAEFLARRFPAPPLVLTASTHHSLVGRLAAHGISGGAVYDALVATTAASHGVTLLTLDVRAEPTYLRMGARFRRLGQGA